MWISFPACGLTAFFRNARNVAPFRFGLAFPEHLAGGDVERGEQVRGAVPDVVVGAFLGRVEGHRQHRLGPVQGLHLGLLVERQHDRAAGRVQVQPDDVGDPLRERRVLRDLEGARPARLEILLPPDPRDVVPGHG
ncbi:hypothetical protein ACIOC2_37215, partial [Streptomyces sp. NPDC088337]|uniref:hypothetical protein n=1 Tax=unclassified Streptomyces TaxID=2593676 RepID=UPI0037FF1D47